MSLTWSCSRTATQCKNSDLFRGRRSEIIKKPKISINGLTYDLGVMPEKGVGCTRPACTDDEPESIDLHRTTTPRGVDFMRI